MRSSPTRITSLWRALALWAGVWLIAPETSAAPDPATWHERYERAKAALVDGRISEATDEFAALEADAPSDADRTLAHELLVVARASDKKQRREYEAAHIRSSDELSVLYASAFIYGLGTSGWVVLLTKPGNIGAAVLPFVGFTGAALGGVAVADAYRPFRRGVPHSIAAGLYLGLGEGVWAVGLQHAGATRRDDASRWRAEAVATALWSGATAGGLLGGLVGYWREPTPGRVSFTSSAATWLGLASGFAGAALESRDRSRVEAAFVVGDVGFNLGIIGGIAFAPAIAPSVTRVRFVDLGTIGGGLLAAGIYAVVADSDATARGGLGAAAIGMGAGAGLTFWATDSMPRDPPRPAAGPTLRPLVLPAKGGFVVGFSGEL